MDDMSCCNSDMNIAPIGMNNGPTIKLAAEFVNVPLEAPVDLSQMKVYSVSVDPKFSEDDRFRYFERRATLATHVINEFGEREELEIEITLKSQRMPKYQP